MAAIIPLRKNLYILACLGLLLPGLVAAQWAAQPGETVRNSFGPSKGDSVSMCRGACGAGCPSACKKQTVYECLDSERLLRVNTYVCNTHQGCRDHDDCLDRCAQNQGQGYDCDKYCHSEAVKAFGLQNAISWAAGGGPFDSVGPAVSREKGEVALRSHTASGSPSFASDSTTSTRDAREHAGVRVDGPAVDLEADPPNIAIHSLEHRYASARTCVEQRGIRDAA